MTPTNIYFYLFICDEEPYATDTSHTQYNNNDKNALAMKISKLTMLVTTPHKTWMS